MKFQSILVFLLLVSFIYSCTSSKQVAILNNIGTKLVDSLSNAEYSFTRTIQKNDQLWISVGGLNFEDLQVINSASGMASGGNMNMGMQNPSMIGYLVEADGAIKLPLLGRITVEGLTRAALEQKLSKELQAYTKEPVVNVRFINYRFTVLGEVARPGNFSMPGERITLLEALGYAGDLTIQANRRNVLIIREEAGKRAIARINLLDANTIRSPYYYLRTNDVVYVEPVPARFFSREVLPQIISVGSGAATFFLLIVTLFSR